MKSVFSSPFMHEYYLFIKLLKTAVAGDGPTSHSYYDRTPLYRLFALYYYCFFAHSACAPL